MPTRRISRVNHLLREELADILRRDVKDDTLSLNLISITEVDTSPDLRTAKVYWSMLGDDEDVQEAQRHLDRAARFIRRGLMDRTDLRTTPYLEFVYDSSIVQGDRIMRLMRQVETQRAAALPPEHGTDSPSAPDNR